MTRWVVASRDSFCIAMLTVICVPGQHLSELTLAADERRHSGFVAYLSEILSYEKLYYDVSAAFRRQQESADGAPPKIPPTSKVPSLSWFKFQFWPANEHVRSALQYTGRFQLRMTLQTRDLRKDHAHAHYCLKQRPNCKAWA